MADLTNKMKKLDVSGDTSGYDSPAPDQLRTSGSGEGSGPQRKADLAYNHLQLAERPEKPCGAVRSRLNVVTNYFRLNAPGTVKFVTFRLDFVTENTRSRGSWDPVKKDKMHICFKKMYEQHRALFPRKEAALVYNGTDMIYCPPDHKITRLVIEFNYAEGAVRNGRQGRPQKAQCQVTPLGLSELATVQVDDEQTRCALMQFLDCVITQEHRFDLTGRAARFIQHGHSLFKIPRTDVERRRDVIPISMGEEVWLGLHAAVKTDGNELMLNADTSGSIFKSMGLRLPEFFAQVLRGYTTDLRSIDTSSILISVPAVLQLERVLKGTKLTLRIPGQPDKVKKFDGFSRSVADQEMFDVNGRQISVADFFLQKHNVRLQFPKFPCLKFYNKVQRTFSSIPMELFWTLDEPTRFKGKLTDTQLDIFVKAVCQNPRDKKERIQRFCVAGGEYLGESAVMREWGVSIERTMVKIENCPVLPLPHIEMKGTAPQIQVDAETGSWKITEPSPEGRERPIKPIELNSNKIVLAVTFIQQQKWTPADTEKVYLLRSTLQAYGMNMHQQVGQFNKLLTQRSAKRGGDYQINHEFFDSHFDSVNSFCKSLSSAPDAEKVDHIPLHVWVFPRRCADTYATIKFYCDVKYGVPSQCTVRKTFEKLTGNCVTNTSAQNLLLKILAKTGNVPFRLSSFAHKNVERLQNDEDPSMIIGIDVSHPGREERFDAIEKFEKKSGMTAEQKNRTRGQHEKLPTARPAGAGMFAGMSFHDTPRSVVSIVGTLDTKGSRYGVSSRVQRLGQEETVNMIEPFTERITAYFENTKQFPKHFIVYRDGASDTQIKKIAYEELESLERAIESFGVEKGAYTITYIMVAKRHHTRFFRENLERMPDDATHLNCPPGTLVEGTITSRSKWDFYLQSHYGNLGTALPTRYCVVRDDWKVSPAFIQTIVFAHCFGNARCPRPLSIPVPLHYAHLAAKRAKVHFDHYKIFGDEEYYSSKEDLVREEFEKKAVTPHENFKNLKAMHFA